jgi:cellulase/cellobiase CelA1
VSSSPSPSTSASASPTVGGPAACTAAYSVTSTWSGGFQASVTVTAGSSAITGWTVAFTLPAGEAVTNLWGGTESASGQSVQVANAAYDGALSAGAGTSFGFTASDTATPTTPSVTCAATG